MSPPSASSGATAPMATTTLRVEGMTCGACTSAIEKGFEGVKGVGAVSISLVMERAVVQHDPSVISVDDVREVIEDRGFDTEVLSSDMPVVVEVKDPFLSDSDDEAETTPGVSTTTLAVGGMTCGACTSAVEGAFKDVSGIKSFSISLLSERAVIEHDAAMISPAQLAETIEDVGFDAKVVDTVVAAPAKKKSSRRQKKPTTLATTVAIEGMTCGACTSAIQGGFDGVDGVLQFNISLLANRAVIVHDPSKLTDSDIIDIIDGRGFDAKVVTSVDGSAQQSEAAGTAHLKIYGLPDAKAAAELQSTLQDRSGIISAAINFSTSRAVVHHQPQLMGLRAVVEAIEAAGYNALVAESEDNNAQLESLAKTKEIQEWKRAFQVSLCFAIPVFLTSMIFPMALTFLDYGSYKIIPGLYLGDVVCLLLTIPVQFGIGKRFYVSAYKTVKHGSATMDVLVVLGTSAAFFFSITSMLVSICIPPHTKPTTLFDTSTMLITFISLSRYLENSAKGQTSKALSRLMSLAPSMATIYADPIAAAKMAEAWEARQDGDKAIKTSMDGGSAAEEKVIATELIEVGDVVILRPGDKIPADGIVTRGETYVDESMITGEAMQVLKKKGSQLSAGTVNGAGRVDFVVTKAGRDTQLSQIVRTVQEAQTNRAPIQHIADWLAGYFVPVIITLGLGTFVGWMVLSHVLPNPPKIFLTDASGGKFMVCVKLCIAVVVFACPCALGLATPTAVMVGTGVGAEQGILIKGGAALQTATKVNHVVFDKTGTLTVGKMSVSQADIQGAWADRKNLWWTLIGLAEMGSEHPIAKAIVRAAKEYLRLGPDGVLDGAVPDFEAVVGKGIIATVEAADAREHKRYRVLIGNLPFLVSQGVDVPEFVDEPLDTSTASLDTKVRSAGITTIHTAIDTTYTGTLGLSDTIKPSARAAVLALKRIGITCCIVTGDNISSALVVASQVGVEPADVHASATPDDKRDIISDLKDRGFVVAMVGDGINDSPALAKADAGIALASGTDVAMEAASIVLMSNTDLLAIPASLLLSRSIFNRIKLNLAWASMYNAVGLPFAMGFGLPWGLHLHPMAAGFAMACSSVSVVTSSLWLKRWKRPKWMKVSVLDPTAEVPATEKEEKVEGPGLVRSMVDFVKESLAARKRNREEVGYVPLRDMGEA
ncbi:copper-transporting ATPase-like protein [Sporormia fimetaria CBS 119925]|uniref:P-type Cu(+) transporter n=1 Tax=Sporormia fimetaria CBS 119925 TaxID=1340428 RepID=A0A6A6VNS3_9PLEO|nr:copper-transporting ATPase-like protein [Sporormia fimetaria CBS 119925]